MFWRLFKKFDVDDTNFISKENLMAAFKRLGRVDISLADVTVMINVHDIMSKDGMISFEEFKRIFKSEDKIKPLQLKE